MASETRRRLIPGEPCPKCGKKLTAKTYRVGRDNTLCSATLAAPAPLDDEELERWRADQHAVVQPSLSHLRLIATIDALRLERDEAQSECARLIDFYTKREDIFRAEIEKAESTIAEQQKQIEELREVLSEREERGIDSLPAFAQFVRDRLKMPLPDSIWTWRVIEDVIARNVAERNASISELTKEKT